MADPYSGRVGRMVNERHFRRESEMCREFGGPSDSELRKKWGLDP